MREELIPHPLHTLYSMVHPHIPYCNHCLELRRHIMYYSLSKQKVLPFPDFSSGNHQKDKFLFSFFTNGRNKSGPIILAFALSADSSNIFISFLVKTTFVASASSFTCFGLRHPHTGTIPLLTQKAIATCGTVILFPFRIIGTLHISAMISMLVWILLI